MENGELYESANSQKKFQWVRNTIFLQMSSRSGSAAMWIYEYLKCVSIR